MVAGFTLLLAKIAALVGWFGDLAKAVFKALWNLVCDAATWPFEQVMDVVVGAVSALDVSGLQQGIGGWGNVPAEVGNILGVLGVGQAATIIASAIGIRLALQLIPFTRLGS